MPTNFEGHSEVFIAKSRHTGPLLLTFRLRDGGNPEELRWRFGHIVIATLARILREQSEVLKSERRFRCGITLERAIGHCTLTGYILLRDCPISFHVTGFYIDPKVVPNSLTHDKKSILTSLMFVNCEII